MGVSPFAGPRAQAVMGIAKPKTRNGAREPDRGLQQKPASERHAVRTAKESAAEGIGWLNIRQSVDETRNIRGTVLPIGIECHDVAGVALQRELDAGLKRCALPKVDRMRDDSGARSQRNLPRCVLRAVIDNRHAVVSAHNE